MQTKLKKTTIQQVMTTTQKLDQLIYTKTINIANNHLTIDQLVYGLEPKTLLNLKKNRLNKHQQKDHILMISI